MSMDDKKIYTPINLRLPVKSGYDLLASVLDEALQQAQDGKGKERHAGKDEAYHDQQIVQLGEAQAHEACELLQARLVLQVRKCADCQSKILFA